MFNEICPPIQPEVQGLSPHRKKSRFEVTKYIEEDSRFVSLPRVAVEPPVEDTFGGGSNSNDSVVDYGHKNSLVTHQGVQINNSRFYANDSLLQPKPPQPDVNKQYSLKDLKGLLVVRDIPEWDRISETSGISYISEYSNTMPNLVTLDKELVEGLSVLEKEKNEIDKEIILLKFQRMQAKDVEKEMARAEKNIKRIEKKVEDLKDKINSLASRQQAILNNSERLSNQLLNVDSKAKESQKVSNRRDTIKHNADELNGKMSQLCQEIIEELEKRKEDKNVYKKELEKLKATYQEKHYSYEIDKKAYFKSKRILDEKHKKYLKDTEDFINKVKVQNKLVLDHQKLNKEYYDLIKSLEALLQEKEP